MELRSNSTTPPPVPVLLTCQILAPPRRTRNAAAQVMGGCSFGDDGAGGRIDGHHLGQIAVP